MVARNYSLCSLENGQLVAGTGKMGRWKKAIMCCIVVLLAPLQGELFITSMSGRANMKQSINQSINMKQQAGFHYRDTAPSGNHNYTSCISDTQYKWRLHPL